jgi:hypothetical protein
VTPEDKQFFKDQLDAMKAEVIEVMRAIQTEILQEIEKAASWDIEEWKE